MSDTYIFWIPEHRSYNNEENPLSSITGSIKKANNWAMALQFVNGSEVHYKKQGGKKVYIVEAKTE